MPKVEDQLVEVRENSVVRNILISLATLKSKVLLWQHDSNPDRPEVEAILLRYLQIKNELIFVPENLPFEFDQKKDLYCVARDNTVLFKKDIFHNSNYKLIMNTPESIMIFNKRAGPRTVLIDDNIMMEYHYGETTHQATEKFPFKSKILDISDGGLSFISRLDNVQKFRPGDKLSIRLPFETNSIMNGKVCYISQMKYQECDKLISRVGIQFTS